MKRTQELEQLCEDVVATPLDVQEYVERVLDTMNTDGFNSSNMRHVVSELWLDDAINGAISKNPELDVKSNPYKPRSLGHILFETSRITGNLVASQTVIDPDTRSRVKHNVAEYDNIITVNGIPVVFEIKLSRSGTGTFHKKIGGVRKRIRKKFSESFSVEEVNRRLYPISIIANCGIEDVGFVYVLRRAKVPNNPSMRGDAHRDFINRGGIILEFPYTRKEFIDLVDQHYNPN